LVFVEGEAVDAVTTEIHRAIGRSIDADLTDDGVLREDTFQSLPEHLAIIDAIVARDERAAEAAARAHLASVLDALRESDQPATQSVLQG